MTTTTVDPTEPSNDVAPTDPQQPDAGPGRNRRPLHLRPARSRPRQPSTRRTRWAHDGARATDQRAGLGEQASAALKRATAAEARSTVAANAQFNQLQTKSEEDGGSTETMSHILDEHSRAGKGAGEERMIVLKMIRTFGIIDNVRLAYASDS